LIVDDEAEVRGLLDYNFAASGFDVITAANGETALRLAQRHRPDVILLDILLPDFDGFTVCRRLRAQPQTAQIPIVVLSSHSGFSVHAAGSEAGARRCLSKTLEIARIVAAVRLTWDETRRCSPDKM
jgi:DNA-binding response OmpR family regulator